MTKSLKFQIQSTPHLLMGLERLVLHRIIRGSILLDREPKAINFCVPIMVC